MRPGRSLHGIAKLWQKQYPNVKLDWGMGNMVSLTEEVLARQQEAGRFLSMGDLEIDRLVKAGLVDTATRTQYADNALAITVPVPDTAGITKIEDLTKPAVKAIAVPDPQKNSVGKHALEAMRGGNLRQGARQDRLHHLRRRQQRDEREGTGRGQMAYLPCVAEVHVAGQPPQVPTGISVTVVPLNYYTPFSCEGIVLKNAREPGRGPEAAGTDEESGGPEAFPGMEVPPRREDQVDRVALRTRV